MKLKGKSALLLSLLLQLCEGFTRPILQSAVPSTLLQAATGIPFDGPATELAVEDEDSPNVGVLLLNLGGPETGEDVEGTFFGVMAVDSLARAVTQYIFLLLYHKSCRISLQSLRRP